jgi:hypothetical protein
MVSENEKPKPPIVLDDHRGIAAQKATDERRSSTEVEADLAATRQAQGELEQFLFRTPATTWTEAAERAGYLLRRFAATAEGQDPRFRKMIAGVVEDFRRLADKT